MVKEQSISELEKELKIAWEKKLKGEGFNLKGGACLGYRLMGEIKKAFDNEHKPAELRVINEGVFKSDYIGKGVYRIYVR